MGGEGSMQAMRTILKNNKNLLRKRSYFKKERSFLQLRREHFKATKGIIDDKPATKEQLLQVRNKIIKQRKRIQLRNIILMLLIAPPLFYFGFQFIGANKPIILSEDDTLQIELKNKKYDFFISDGDNYIKMGQWHNAIFQYHKATELFPSRFDAHYRGAYAKTYRCRNTKTNCEIAKKAVNDLLLKFPENQELVELEQVLVFVAI